MYNNWAEIYIGKSGASSCRAYFRFTSVNIPQGATIVSAILQLTAYASDSNTTCAMRIKCEDSDNPTAPEYPSDLTGRSLTDAYADWTVDAWTDGTVYDTPDFDAAVKEVVDRVGWASGNALTVHLLDNGSSNSAARKISSYDYSSGAEKAKLTVVYTL